MAQYGRINIVDGPSVQGLLESLTKPACVYNTPEPSCDYIQADFKLEHPYEDKHGLRLHTVHAKGLINEIRRSGTKYPTRPHFYKEWYLKGVLSIACTPDSTNVFNGGFDFEGTYSTHDRHGSFAYSDFKQISTEGGMRAIRTRNKTFHGDRDAVKFLSTFEDCTGAEFLVVRRTSDVVGVVNVSADRPDAREICIPRFFWIERYFKEIKC